MYIYLYTIILKSFLLILKLLKFYRLIEYEIKYYIYM